jgi:polyphosphate kinase
MPYEDKHSLKERHRRYINRELSWMAFNNRVFGEAINPANPLLERVKFLAITASNLDEFTMVRIAGLKEQVRHAIPKLSDDGMTPAEQIAELAVLTKSLLQAQQECWMTMKDELEASGIRIVEDDELCEERRATMHAQFLEDIFPALSPIAIDPAHPFPFLPNLGLAQLFDLKNIRTGKHMTAVLPLPSKLPRFVPMDGNHPMNFMLLEDITYRFAHVLFPGFEVQEAALFRIVRDSDLEIEEDAEDLIEHYEYAVKQRRRGKVIRIKTLANAPRHLVNLFLDHMDTDIQQVHEMQGMLGLNALFELYALERPELKYPPYHVRFPERITEYDGDCFAAIAAKDIIVHHPYESFDVVVQFLKQAARDPKVVSIKQTLYRTSDNSPIVKALIRAAESGKSVTALVELRARFDEEANIKWARDLERAGVQVVYGFVNIKTHAKISIVVRSEQDTLTSYVHFGTGNYHPINAKIYTDLSYFTCNKELAQDAHYLFNYITGYGEPATYRHIITAPNHMRNQLIALIQAEIAHAKAGRGGSIWAKMNALVDPAIIDTLYEASDAGVQIDLVVRGICCLRSRVKGLSDNIRVKSIVGRFLEHSRIYCFGNGHELPHKDALVYIGSADCMPRNLDWRVEMLVPVLNDTVHAQVLDQIMRANLKDNLHSWEQQADGHYERATADAEHAFSAHRYFIENPSLSGRGKALAQEKRRKKGKEKE